MTAPLARGQGAAGAPGRRDPSRGGEAAPHEPARWRFALWDAGRAAEFVQRGHRLREFFPHRAAVLRKPGPDGLLSIRAMAGAGEPAELRELVLWAEPALAAEFPRDVFFDPDVVWHQQHFGRAGQVATADLRVDGGRIWTTNHLSDLVQRIGRRRELRTRVENRFRGWHALLLNALLGYAAASGARAVHTPTAALVLRHTDPERRPRPELFERVYDRVVARLFRARREGDWWVLEVAANRDRLVAPASGEEPLAGGPAVCVCHDVERGTGHLDVDPAFALRAEETAPASLEAMLRVEGERGLRATYCVVGAILPELRGPIEAGGHALAFHSWDHAVEGPAAANQLSRCRLLDYRIKGYRPPRSVLTPELTDENLVWHNVEWLASSPRSLGGDDVELRNGVVRIPVLADDWELYSRGADYGLWEARLLEELAGRRVAAFSLHDCYGPFWLPRYERLLDRVQELGTVRTLDDVAADAALASSEWP
jgi:hypothetical protein